MKLLFTIDFAAPVIGLLLASHAVIAGTPASAPKSRPWKMEGSRLQMATPSRLPSIFQGRDLGADAGVPAITAWPAKRSPITGAAKSMVKSNFI